MGVEEWKWEWKLKGEGAGGREEDEGMERYEGREEMREKGEEVQIKYSYAGRRT